MKPIFFNKKQANKQQEFFLLIVTYACHFSYFYVYKVWSTKPSNLCNAKSLTD
jgi:hypothetical protein